MKVILVEEAFHSEVLRAYARVFLQTGVDVVIITHSVNQRHLSDLTSNHLDWIIDESPLTQVSLASPLQEDVVLYISLEKKQTIPPSHGQKWLVVHGVRDLFDPLKPVGVDHSSIWTRGKSIVKVLVEWQRIKRKKNQTFLKQFDVLVFPTVYMQKYYRGPMTSVVLDFTVFEKASPMSTSKDLVIAVPGKVSQNARDYLTLIDALEKWTMDQKAKVYFLGQLADRSIVSAVRGFKNNQVEIITFDESIPQKQFDEILLSADFLICPLQKTYRKNSTLEENGYTHISGNINDMVRFKLPAILPDHYPLDEELEQLALRYSDAQDMLKTMEQCIANKEYNTIKSSVNLSNFTPDRLKAKFMNAVNRSGIN